MLEHDNNLEYSCDKIRQCQFSTPHNRLSNISHGDTATRIYFILFHVALLVTKQGHRQTSARMFGHDDYQHKFLGHPHSSSVPI